MGKKRTTTVFSKAKGSEIATGVEISEFSKTNGKTEGRILFRFFVSDNSKEQVKFMAEPWEAFDLFHKINKVARSTTSCKEQIGPHNYRRDGGIETLTSVTVEKWVKEERSGFAIIGSQTVDGKSSSFNVSIPNGSRILFLGKFLESLSIMQSWEMTE